jgi:hypothetical protein
MLEQTRKLWRKVIDAWPSFLSFRKKPSTVRPPLGKTARDTGIALLKGAVGAIPLAGGIIGEVIGEIIPQQRFQRLEVFVRYLNERFEAFDKTEALARMHDPKNIALFEDGAIQSARALTDGRRERIARIVAYGITGGEKQKIEVRRLLELFAQIDDDQIVILTSFLTRHDRNRDEAFWKRHQVILSPDRPHLNSTNDERETYAIAQMAKERLIQLGLLLPQFDKPKNGGIPDLPSLSIFAVVAGPTPGNLPTGNTSTKTGPICGVMTKSPSGSVASDVPERSVRRIAPTAPDTGEAWPDHWPRPSRLLPTPEPIETVTQRCGFRLTETAFPSTYIFAGSVQMKG